jgi:hypothetical protein
LKRLIAYIYGYKNGVKGKNTGFGKIDTKGNDIKMNITLRYNGEAECLKVYFFVRKEEKTYILYLGDMEKGMSEYELRRTVNIKELSRDKCEAGDIHGILIKGEEDIRYISFWKEEYNIGETVDMLKEVLSDDKEINEIEEEKLEVEEKLTIEEHKEIEIEEDDTVYLVEPDCTPVNDSYVAKQIELRTTSICQYMKNKQIKEVSLNNEKCNMCEISPKDIYEFPRECWCVGKNAYACHGFIKYGRLFVIEMDDLYLAVPGYNSTNERIIAERYGFGTFVENETECLQQSSCTKWERGYWCKKMLTSQETKRQ